MHVCLRAAILGVRLLRLVLSAAASNEHVLHPRRMVLWSDSTAETYGTVGGTLHVNAERARTRPQ